MIASIIGTVVGLVLVTRTGETYRDALTVAESAGVLAAETAVAASDLSDDLVIFADVLDTEIANLRELTSTAAEISDTLGEAARTNVADAVQGVADVADRLARILRLLERFVPGESQSIAEELAAISDGLAPIPDQLREVGEQILHGADDLRAIEASLKALQGQMSSLAAKIAQTAATLDELPDTSANLVAAVERARDRSELDLWLLRTTVFCTGLVAFGIGVALRRIAGRDDPEAEVESS